MNIVKDELFVYDKYIKKCFFKKSQSNNLIEKQFISGTHSYAQQDYKIELLINALYTRH